jgi:hypothetical protein
MRNRESVRGLLGYERDQEACRDSNAGQYGDSQSSPPGQRLPYLSRTSGVSSHPPDREQEEGEDGIYKVSEEQQADP